MTTTYVDFIQAFECGGEGEFFPLGDDGTLDLVSDLYPTPAAGNIAITAPTPTITGYKTVVVVRPQPANLNLSGKEVVIDGYNKYITPRLSNIVFSGPTASLWQAEAPIITTGSAVVMPVTTIAFSSNVTAGGELAPTIIIKPKLPKLLFLGSGPVAKVYYPMLAEDNLQGYDIPVPGWFAKITDTVLSEDSSNLQLLILLKDFTRAVESLTLGLSASPTITENLLINDFSKIAHVYKALIEEAVLGTDIASGTVSVLIAEYLGLRGAALPLAFFRPDILDSVQAVDKSIAQWFLSVMEDVGAVDAATTFEFIAGEVSETISLAELLSAAGVYLKEISDKLSATDLIKFAWALVARDSLSGADSITAVSLLSGLISDAVVASDGIISTRRMFVASSDVAEMLDTSSGLGVFGVTVSEALSANIFVIIDGEEYECFVLNTSAFHPSIYSEFNFNSYCTFRGRTFAASDAGIVEIAGDTDSGTAIGTGVVFHETDFGMPESKRFRKAYLGVSGNSPVVVMESENGVRIVYSVNDNGVVAASRAIKGRTWNLSISNFDILDSVKLTPIILSRGTR